MLQRTLADADRLDAIRRTNRRRPVSVVDAFDLTPSLRRVILQEMEPSVDEPPRPAEWIKLHVPPSGSGRKHGRAYTIRERSGGQITLDMALHGGLCASWARRARVGDRAEISGARNGLKLSWPPPGDVLLGGDETGLAGAASILASLPRDTRGAAWLEVPGQGDVLPLDAPPAVAVHFLPRKGALPGQLLVPAMREAPLSPATTVWVAAERAAALELRDHFQAALPGEQVRTSGYWRMPIGGPNGQGHVHIDTRVAEKTGLTVCR